MVNAVRYASEDCRRRYGRLVAELDVLSETADERGEALLGALYEYVETVAPEV